MDWVAAEQGCGAVGCERRGFSLIELLVVVGIIAVLIAILLPSLAKAKEQAKTTSCLANMRNLQMSQIMYAEDNDGWLVQSGLDDEGGAPEPGGWIYSLQKYYSSRLLARCAADSSPLWPASTNTTGDAAPDGAHRRTSYGINNFLDEHHAFPSATGSKPPPYLQMKAIHTPARVIQFMEMAETGDFAVSDHVHIEEWGVGPGAPAAASIHLQIHRHGGPVKAWESRANWGFLDGRAETLKFKDVYTDLTKNLLDPGLSN